MGIEALPKCAHRGQGLCLTIVEQPFKYNARDVDLVVLWPCAGKYQKDPIDVQGPSGQPQLCSGTFKVLSGSA